MNGNDWIFCSRAALLYFESKKCLAGSLHKIFWTFDVFVNWLPSTLFCTFPERATSPRVNSYYEIVLRQSFITDLQETAVCFNRVKRLRLSVVIGKFQSIMFISDFQGSMAVALLMIDGREKRT